MGSRYIKYLLRIYRTYKQQYFHFRRRSREPWLEPTDAGQVSTPERFEAWPRMSCFPVGTTGAASSASLVSSIELNSLPPPQLSRFKPTFHPPSLAIQWVLLTPPHSASRHLPPPQTSINKIGLEMAEIKNAYLKVDPPRLFKLCSSTCQRPY